MFGLSKKEILSNAIMNASKNNLNIYKQGLKDNWEKVIDEESMQEIVMKIRKEYLNKVFEDIVAGLNVSAPSVASKIRFVANNSSVCGYNMDDTYGKMAGHVFAICYYAMTNKKADAEQCIKLNHMQDALMKEVLHELDSEMSQEEDDGVGNERIEKIYNPISAYVNTIFAHFTGSSLKRKLIDREHNNIVVIYSYLLAILYAEWKDRKGTEDAEQMAKAMAYELLFNRMNLEEEQGEKLFDYMSNVITKTQSMKRLILSGKEFQNSTLEEQLAIYIVKDVLFYDKEYVTPDEENKNLIAQIKQDLVYFKNGMIKDFENETKEQNRRIK